jgi:hypothetical protein
MTMGNVGATSRSSSRVGVWRLVLAVARTVVTSWVAIVRIYGWSSITGPSGIYFLLPRLLVIIVYGILSVRRRLRKVSGWLIRRAFVIMRIGMTK